MRYFPIFLDLQSARAVVIGGNEEAVRKIRLLLKTSVTIDLVTETFPDELSGHAQVKWLAKAFKPEHLDGAAIAFSAMPQFNAEIFAAAKARNIPFNAVDDAPHSTFIIPSIVDRDPVVVAIGTEGAAPVLGQHLRGKIDALLPLNLGEMAKRAASLRDVVAQRLSHGLPRRSFWTSFFFGKLAEAQASGDEVAYELELGDTLFANAQHTHGRYAEVLVPDNLGDLTISQHRALLEADVIVHDGSQPALLEMARRDAKRVRSATPFVCDQKSGCNIVKLVSNKKAPFDVNATLRDTILKAAS